MLNKLLILCLLFFLSGCSDRTYRLVAENDVFAPQIFKNLDRGYSHGTALSSSTPEAYGSSEISVKQIINTPSNGTLKENQPNDRPYSGYLAAGYQRNYTVAERTEHNYAIDVGCVGPCAMSGHSQNFVHRVIGQNEKQGWSNQIPNQGTVNLLAERNYRTEPVVWNGIEIDAIDSIGAKLGNVFTLAQTGGAIRFGKNLPSDYGPTTIYPRLPRYKPSYSYYFFVGADGRATAYNAFFDGTLWRDSNRVTKEPFTIDGKAGIAGQYGKFKVSYTVVVLSPEFEEQRYSHAYGSINIAYIP